MTSRTAMAWSSRWDTGAPQAAAATPPPGVFVARHHVDPRTDLARLARAAADRRYRITGGFDELRYRRIAASRWEFRTR